MDPVLVVFTTTHGSTGEVAEAIAGQFNSLGWPSELREIRERPSLTGRRLVVVGAPIYNGRWSSAARRYLKRNRSALGAVPVAVFGMGPREATDEAVARSRSQLERSLTKLAWLDPLRTVVFGGVDPPKKHLHRDVRDWDAIDAWCTELARVLSSATTIQAD